MFCSRFKLISSAAMLGLSVGCSSNSTGSAYPTPQPPAQSSLQDVSADPTMQRVPAGAQVVAYGEPPLPAFNPPNRSGLLYIFDNETSLVVRVTSITSSGYEPVNLANYPNVTNALDPKHKYTVYFVSQANATTLPSPLPGS